MKSRKLFAILTLVAFMMTLVPALAFGGDTGEAYSASASKISKVSNNSPKVGRTSVISVQFRTVEEVDGKPKTKILASTPINEFWVKVSRDGVDVSVESENIVDDSELIFVAGIAKVETGELKTNGSGVIKFNVNSAVAKPVTISFWGEAPAKDDDEFYLIDETTIDFAADKGRVSEVELFLENEGDTQVGKEITLFANVYDESGNGLEDRLVTFYKKKDGGSWVRIGSVDTDGDGVAEIDFYETKAGEYEYEARSTGKKSEDNPTLSVKAGDPAVIEAVTADGKVFDVSEDGEVKFVVKDSEGNKIVPEEMKDLKDLIEVTYLSVPKDSDVEDDDVVYNLEDNVTSDDELVVGIPFDEEGDYKLKAKIAGYGKYITLTVTAKEAGETEDIIVKFKKDGQKSLIASEDEADSLVLEVKLVDEFGIEIDADDYKAYSSDVSLVKTVTLDSGELTIEGPKDDKKRGVAKITVVDLDTAKTASIDVPVVGKPYAIDADYVVSGKAADVTLQFVDNDDAVTRAKDEDVDYELLLPNGVVVSDKKKFDKDSGEATFKATVEEYGEYNLTAVAGNGIAKKFTLVVGVPDSEKEVIGAESVTMFIGSSGYVQDGVAKITDVAPFIKDDRTFVAIRPVADAFGCEIGWDEVEQKVTLVRDDVVVTIIIGSSDIEVVEDGVVSVVEADVPAFIVDGRTVLPFRAVGNAFGATVDYDEVTQSVTYTQS